jgi:hypothetical protein
MLSKVDPLAIYGALVGTAAFGWQIYSWRRDRSTNVEVRLSQGVLTPSMKEAVFIEAINHSNHPIRINTAGLVLQDRSGDWAVSQEFAQGGLGLPGVVAPNDSGQTWWSMGEVEQARFDLHKPIVARVVAGKGMRFHSKPTTLRKR